MDGDIQQSSCIQIWFWWLNVQRFTSALRMAFWTFEHFSHFVGLRAMISAEELTVSLCLLAVLTFRLHSAVKIASAPIPNTKSIFHLFITSQQSWRSGPRPYSMCFHFLSHRKLPQSQLIAVVFTDTVLSSPSMHFWLLKKIQWQTHSFKDSQTVGVISMGEGKKTVLLGVCFSLFWF